MHFRDHLYRMSQLEIKSITAPAFDTPGYTKNNIRYSTLAFVYKLEGYVEVARHKNKYQTIYYPSLAARIGWRSRGGRVHIRQSLATHKKGVIAGEASPGKVKLPLACDWRGQAILMLSVTSSEMKCYAA